MKRASTNEYTNSWLATFATRVAAAQTDREIRFLLRHLTANAVVLDLCCGTGRHANPLARSGLTVIGVDRSRYALELAARERSGAHYIEADVAELPVKGPFDAAICMWQSFGWSDDDANRGFLARARDLLQPRGRLVLDIYDRRFFEANQGARISTRAGTRVVERKTLNGTRLTVELQYDGAAGTETFDWRVYTPTEIIAEAGSVGLGVVCCCAEFDEAVPASAAVPRMQLVFAPR